MLLRGKKKDSNDSDMLRKLHDEVCTLNLYLQNIKDRLFAIEEILDDKHKDNEPLPEVNHNEIKALRAELNRKNQFIEDILTKFIMQATTQPASTQILNTVDTPEPTARSKTMEEYIARKNKENVNAVIKLP